MEIFREFYTNMVRDSVIIKGRGFYCPQLLTIAEISIYITIFKLFRSSCCTSFFSYDIPVFKNSTFMKSNEKMYTQQYILQISLIYSININKNIIKNSLFKPQVSFNVWIKKIFAHYLNWNYFFVNSTDQ